MYKIGIAKCNLVIILHLKNPKNTQSILQIFNFTIYFIVAMYKYSFLWVFTLVKLSHITVSAMKIKNLIHLKHIKAVTSVNQQINSIIVTFLLYHVQSISECLSYQCNKLFPYEYRSRKALLSTTANRMFLLLYYTLS